MIPLYNFIASDTEAFICEKKKRTHAKEAREIQRVVLGITK